MAFRNCTPNDLWSLIRPLLVATLTVGPIAAAETIVVEFPDPALFFLNTTYAIDGDAAYVPSFNNDTLWSFSVTTGELLDPNGLPLQGPASDPFLFADNLLAMPGWFPSQGVFVANVSDPTNLTEVGVIAFAPTTNIQGQNIEVDDDGVIGYVASFPNDTLYAINVQTLAHQDPNGLALPGNPDRIALAGDRLAIVDTTFGRILVADVSDPSNLTLAGIIELPGADTFGSNDNIVFAADDRTGFVTTNQRVLYSFDVLTLTVLDPGGLVFGEGSFGDHIAIHGDTLACISSRGLSFIDAGDPSQLSLIANAAFGTTVAPQGSATVAFTSGGAGAAIPVVFPGNFVYTFEVATGNQVAPRVGVDDQPNFLNIFGPQNTVGVLCAGNNADNIWLIGDLFPPTGDIDGDGDVDLNDYAQFLDCVTGPGGGVPPGCQSADMDNDADVDWSDFALFQLAFNA